jgi:hypothetical protein
MKIIRFAKHAAVSLSLLVAGIFTPLSAGAAMVTFHFTGRITVVSPGTATSIFPSVVDAEDDGYTPISADLTIDTAYTGGGFDPGALIGSSTLNVTVNDFFLGAPAYFHDMTLAYGGSGIVGDFLVNWGAHSNIPVQVDWDVSGLTTAIDYGLQLDDKISGDLMSRDTDGDGVADTVVIGTLGSATPVVDLLDPSSYSPYPAFTLQGPAPMASTGFSQGILSGPFDDFLVFVDIGSGNSMVVTSVSAVPIPAAIWLFGSGLAGLTWTARRRRGQPG